MTYVSVARKFGAALALVLLTGCYTTRYELVGKTVAEDAEPEHDTFPSDYPSDSKVKVTKSWALPPAEITRHCNGGNVAAIETTSRGRVDFFCADGTAKASKGGSTKGKGKGKGKKKS